MLFRSKYEGLFWSVDRLNYQYDTKTRGKRKYIFNVAHDDNVAHSSNDDNVEAVQQELPLATSAT